jgi:hypothetical protein
LLRSFSGDSVAGWANTYTRAITYRYYCIISCARRNTAGSFSTMKSTSNSRMYV